MSKKIAYRNVDSAPKAEGNVIEGYALYWNKPSKLSPFSKITESFAERSFTDAIKAGDPVLKIEHGGTPLARMSAGNFSVTEDDKGLRYRAELDVENDHEARTMYSRVQRGVVKGASVGFLIPGTEVTTERGKEGNEHDLITKVSELREISLTGMPVHPSTATTRAIDPEAAEANEDKANARRLTAARDSLRIRITKSRMAATR